MVYLLPFAASVLYVFAALLLKRAAERGAGLLRTLAVTNLFCGLVFGALWAMGGRIPDGAWHQPAIAAFCFVAGQLLGLLSLQRGAVSVATPVLGVKVVLVAVFVTLVTGEGVPGRIWLAAALSSAGLVFLGRPSGPPIAGQSVAAAVGFGIPAAAGFAMFDVLVQAWAPAWGAGRFLPLTMLAVGLYSIVLLLVLPRSTARGGGGPLYAGGFLMAVQAVLLIGAMGVYGRATTVNIVYSARGLWSVLFVWLLGPLFANRERDAGAAALRVRLIGALLLMAAIALAMRA